MNLYVLKYNVYFSDTTIKGPKRPPTSIQVYGVNSTTVRVAWHIVAVSEEEEKIKGYKVRVWEDGDDISTAKEIIVPDGEKSEAIVDSLKPDHLYKLRVLAYSESGDGRMSSPAPRFQTS